MKTVYFCDSTGKISGCATSNTEEDEPYAEMSRADGESLAWEDGPPISGDVQASHYFLDGVLTPRPEMSITQSKTTMLADGVDTITFSNVPTGATATVREWTGNVNDGSLTLAMALVGGFSVSFSKWPYKDSTFYATANP